MDLFTKPTEKLDYSNLKILVYGDSGVGKSFFWNSFPGKTRLISTDGNYKHLINKNFDKFLVKETHIIEDEEYKGWAIFKGIVHQAEKGLGGFDKIDNIVIDVIFDIYQYCRKYVLEKNGISHESDIAYGKGWKFVEDEFFPVIKKLLALDKSIIIVSHEKNVEGKKMPKEGEGFYNKIHPYMQLKGYAYRTEDSNNNEKFTITFTPTLQHVGGNVYNIKAPINNTFDDLIKTIKRINENI